MGRPRFSVAGLMKVVVWAALGAAALREGWEGRAFAVFVLVAAILIEATLRARFGFERDRAWWFGFAVFGWAHLGFGGTQFNDFLPTIYLIPERFHAYLPINRGQYLHDRFLILVAWTSLIVAYLGAVFTSWYAGRWSRSASMAGPAQGAPLTEDAEPRSSSVAAPRETVGSCMGRQARCTWTR